MVKALQKLAARVVLALLICLGVTACGSSTLSEAGAGPSSPSEELTPKAKIAPAPAPPAFLDCGGAIDLASAALLVNQGLAEALVKVTITEQPGDVTDNVRDVSVASYQLLSGALDSGPVLTIQEGDEPSSNSLPPGDYAVLLGTTGQDGTYFLSDGLRGSFVLDVDATAIEQCPTFSTWQSVGTGLSPTTGQPEPKQGSTAATDGSSPQPLSELVSLMNRVFADQGAS